MNDSTSLDTCGCCEGLTEPAPVRNDPGLPALDYRIDLQPGFRARMLERLPLTRADADDPGSPRPLARLLSRRNDDPSVALIDASACVADVLTFYNERIANEGFLRTATERRSVLELARAIGYELKPGVASSVYLSFTVEDAPGAPGVCTLAQGMPVQSVPPQDKLPQVFETSAPLTARAEWNALVPRQLRPADMAIIDVTRDDGTTQKVLALLGPSGSFPPDTLELHTGLLSKNLFHLDPGLATDQNVDAVEVRRVYVPDTTTGVAVGDMLLFVGKRAAELTKLALRVVAVISEPKLKRICIDVEALPDPTAAPLPAITYSVPYIFKPIALFAKPKLASISLTSGNISTTVTGQAWHESDLTAMIAIQGWSSAAIVKTVSTVPSAPPIAPEAGLFAFDARLGFFGHSAPKWRMLLRADHQSNGYSAGWDAGDPSTGSPSTPLGVPRAIWTDSQGGAIGPSAFLERSVPGASRGSWTIFDSPEVETKIYGVFDARETSRADYGLSGRAMSLILANDDGTALPKQTSPAFPFRSTTAYIASRKLVLADLPIDAPVEAGETTIELEKMVLGLAVGQPVALTGERDDLPGVSTAEIAILADIIHADGRTTLILRQGLLYSYLRSSLRISANVVHATHGESIREVLGNGDATTPNQSFVLKRPPTTFLSAPTASGIASTLEVRIGGVRWDEVPSLYAVAPEQTVYMTRIDDDANLRITFGDGVSGARLPTGNVNITATYRSGIGPDGEVASGTLTMLRAMPLGLRGVTNPIAASGAEGPEVLADARRNAPLTLLTFDRVVSLLDYENYARGYPGIGKARGDVLWTNGIARVFLTVAGATGGPPGDDVLNNLQASIGGASDPSQPFSVAAFAARYFTLSATIAIDPRYLFDDVQAGVLEKLLASFGFESRDLAQSVTAAQILALIHTVPGVIAADIVELLPYSDDAPPAGTALDAVPAFRARHDAATAQTFPAELLLINPAGVTLTEMSP